MAVLALDVVVQQVLDDAESESETTDENYNVVPDIGREEVVQSSTMVDVIHLSGLEMQTS